MTSERGSCNKICNKAKKLGLSKTERLKGRQKIKRIFSDGKKFHSGELTIIYLSSKKQAVVFLASKSIGGAVKRNRIRRILREAYRMNKDIFKELKVIFYAQGPLTHKDIQSCFKAFEERGWTD